MEPCFPFPLLNTSCPQKWGTNSSFCFAQLLLSLFNCLHLNPWVSHFYSCDSLLCPTMGEAVSGCVGLSGQLGLNHDTCLKLGIIQCQSWRSCSHALSFRMCDPSQGGMGGKGITPPFPCDCLCCWRYMVGGESCSRVMQCVPCKHKFESVTLGCFVVVCCSLLLIMNKADFTKHISELPYNSIFMCGY